MNKPSDRSLAEQVVLTPQMMDDLKKLGKQLDDDPEFVRQMRQRLDLIVSNNPARHDH